MAGDRRAADGLIPFLDFTVDGESLGDRFSGDMTALTVDDAAVRTECLRRLGGEPITLPSFRPEFHKTRLDRMLRLRGTPEAPHESAFADGRIALYYCSCGDMDCGVVSTRLEFTETTVIWHDVGWQVTYEPFEALQEVGVQTYEFARADYDDLIAWLLTADWTQTVPRPT